MTWDQGSESPADAVAMPIPSEAGGQLVRGDERHWYAIDVKRGEVLYLEAFGERIGSPVDLDVSILDEAGQRELVSFHDELTNVGGIRFPMSHLDPGGRWVAPADGRYLVMIRNLIGSLAEDPRRIYRLTLRREEPSVRLVAIAQLSSPAGVNVPRGGRSLIEVLAYRKRGFNGSVRVSARNLPPGVSCADSWLGPGVSAAPLVLTAQPDAGSIAQPLELVGHAEQAGLSEVPVLAGAMIRSGSPVGSGRLTASLPFAVAGDAALQIAADGHETRDHHLYGALRVRHSPGGVLDVAVAVDRRPQGHAAPIRLTGYGLPDTIGNQSAVIPAGADKGYLSFYLPHSLPVGTYCLAIRAETEVPASKNKTQTISAYSNVVTFEVHPPAFRLDLDLAAPTKIVRGQTVQVPYSVRRINGFIGKIHTELAAPGRVTDVGRLRGRGVTSVGQSETGAIQIVANEEAELGQLPFLRLYAVGVLEDEPMFHGSCFLNLEIVE